MSVPHGKSTVFKLDNASGTLTDLSSYIDNVDFGGFNFDTAETTTFGATGSAKTYVVGLTNGTFTLSGPWDGASGAIDAHMGGIATAGGELSAGGTLTFEYGPDGSTTGNVKYTGECYMTSYNTTSPVGGRAGWTAAFQISGAVTRTTW